jgi:hypothetical protein
MAAGQGFKTFTTGEVLTAGDVNGYLMQGINVFTNATARDAAITAPAEGQFAFTKDNNSLWYYDGAAWVASGATGDIEGVTAGVGISGGGTSGTVTVTNSMATAIDAKGDLVPGTGADTFARLAVGANGTVLTADSAEATGLKWAAAATSGMTKIVTGNFSASAGVAINECFTSTYSNYVLVLNQLGNSGGGAMYLQWQTGTNTVANSADYYGGGWSVTNGNSTATFTNNGSTYMTIAPTVATNLRQNFTINISNVAVSVDVGSSSRHANLSSLGNGSGNGIATYAGIINNSGTYTGVYLTANGNLTGTYTVYGLAK